jgi:hypothetical protein
MSDDEYEIPLQDQRVFGAGLKRKCIHFVPSTTSSGTLPPQPAAGSTSVGDRYLSLVLSKATSKDSATPNSSSTSPPNEDSPPDDTPPPPLCEICSLPLSSATTKPPHPHEATLAHQVCLKHSHPPSHLDRSRLGLRYLQAQGWDPDSRLGLGAQGQGIQFPIKAKLKDDKMGLGLVFPGDMGAGVVKKEVKEKLDAGKVRKLEERDRRKREKLQDLFYRSEDLDRYLGSG